jgi:outer membrane receptor protein involved in Fe transport
MNKKPLTSLVASKAKGTATVCGLALASILFPAVSWAQAQTQAPAPVEQIIVTGTRLPDPNLISSSPIQVVTAREIAISGKNDAFDILQMLPQNLNNDLGQDLGNRTSGLTTAGGVATADLRGLGPNRTLVLVNGRRIGNGSPNTAISSPAPDLDQIPARLIERVEVVTGGASAVYGSDAIAGVVNFITKTNFEGIEFDAQTGFNVHDNSNAFAQKLARDAGFTPASGTVTDGRSANYNLIGGSNTANGKGNFTAWLGYQSQDGVQSGNRDFGAGQLFTDTDANGVPTGDVFMSGSSNSNRFQPKTGPRGTDPTAIFSVVGTNFAPFGTDANPPAAYNSQKLIYMSRQYKRATAGVIGHYDLNDHVQPYVEFGYTNDKTHQEIAPSALFRQSNVLTADGNYPINCSNPLLSTQQRNILCTAQEIADDTAVPGSVSASVEIGRRNVEGGQRFSDYEHTNYRAVGGLRGEIGPAWSYDAYAQYYYVQFFTTNNRYLNFQKIDNALQVTTGANGPVCISGSPCIPYNIFKDGGVTPDALSYLYTNGTAYGTTTLRTVHADFTADLGHYGLKLRGANQGVSLNVGYETRQDKVAFAPDEASLSGLLSGFAGASVSIDRSVSVNEYFAEIRVPLLEGKKHVQDLSFDAGFRRSDYSTSGPVNTSKFEIQYAPVSTVRLRTSLNKAIRAPSIIELFNPQFIGQITIGADPCAPTLSATFQVIPAVNTLQQCLRTVRPDQAAAFTAAYGNGGTTNQIPQGTASQLSQVQGGNQLLRPETADSYSIGVTLTPDRAKGFTTSVDLWHVKLTNEVGTLPAGVILNGCPDTGDPVFCSQLVRQPQTFSLQGASVANGGYIVQTSQNIAAAESGGIDVQGAYRLDFQRRGSLTFAWVASHMLSNKTTSYIGAHTYDCAGLFGLTCQTVNPEWRHVVRATWATPKGVSATLSWRHISEVKEDNNDSDPTLKNSAFAGFDPFNAKIGAKNYFDLAATYEIKKLQLRAGINNILDKEPPMLGSEIVGGGSPNTYSTYDMFGREVFMAFNVKF